MRFVLSILTVLICASRLAADEPIRAKLKIPIPQTDLQKVGYRYSLDIERGGPDYLYGYMTDLERSKLDSAKIKYELLFEDYRDETAWVISLFDFGEYHTYEETAFFLDSVATARPEICQLDTMGSSLQGRLILGIRISDNPGIEEDEPEVRIMGAHHGDEKISVELPLYLIDLLTVNYGIDSLVTRLVNEREIFVIPMVNPDGVTNNSRYNARYQDINRDYLCPEGDDCPANADYEHSFSEPETQAIRDDALLNRYVLSLSMHSGATNINAVWNYDDGLHPDGEYHPTPDDDLIMDLSYGYANLNRTPGFYVTNGCDWYSTHGDANDYSYGYHSDIDWTIEISQLKAPPQDEIETYWLANREAMLFIIDAADIGIRGTVVDSVTGDPLEATIRIEQDGYPFYTDPFVGDYHRPLLPGSYNVRIESPGYESRETGPIEVADGPAQEYDIQLVPAEMATLEISAVDSVDGHYLSSFVNIRSGNLDTLVFADAEPVTITLEADIYDIEILVPGYLPAFDHRFVTGYDYRQYPLQAFDTEIFVDDFENDLSAWVFGGAYNQWDLADRGYISPQSLEDSPGNYHQNGRSRARIDGILDFSSFEKAGACFFEEHYLQPYYDFLFAEISTDGGSSWIVLPDTLTGFSTSSWRLRYLTLDDYCGERFDNVQFRFRFFSGPYVNYDGVYIDNVYLGGLSIPTDVGPTVELPAEIKLNQNYPNPFNSTTIITLDGNPETYPPAEIYDILGRMVRRLESGDGQGMYIWDGRDGSGSNVSSGIYFYKISGTSKIRSMILLR
jgi:hypothetical protein